MRNEAHPRYLGFQLDWPVYVKCPVLVMQGKTYKRGDYFPWSEVQADPEKVASMYQQKLIHHDQNKTKDEGFGDRLGEMSGSGLKSLVGLMNNHLKKNHCASEEEFKRKRCRQSSILDTQRRFVRQFLAKNPYMTDFFLENRDDFITKVIKKED